MNKPKERQLYRCGECGLKYLDPQIAQKCQQWCKIHKSCNLEIIKKSISQK